METILDDSLHAAEYLNRYIDTHVYINVRVVVKEYTEEYPTSMSDQQLYSLFYQRMNLYIDAEIVAIYRKTCHNHPKLYRKIDHRQ